MRLNPLPFLFLPGVAMLGYLVDEWTGVAWALALWGGLVLAGTVFRVRRHLAERRQGDEAAVSNCAESPTDSDM